MITSENYPSNYPNNVDTIQTILVAEGNTVWIRFEAMDIEGEDYSYYEEYYEEYYGEYEYYGGCWGRYC